MGDFDLEGRSIGSRPHMGSFPGESDENASRGTIQISEPAEPKDPAAGPVAPHPQGLYPGP